MSYPARLLTEGEVVVRAFRPHWKSLVIPVLWTMPAVVGAVLNESLTPTGFPRNAVYGIIGLGWIVISGMPILRWWFTKFVLTNERLILRQGIVARSGVEIPLEVINDVLFSQTVFERLLGFGDLVIESAGEQGQSRFSNIPRPEDFQSELYRQREIRARDLSGAGPEPAIDTLARLARLHEDGVISDTEFATKKQKLLDEI